jgi:MFS family permease
MATPRRATPPVRAGAFGQIRSGQRSDAPLGPGYKWIALSNVTIGVLIVTIDGSIVLISMPDIFRGIGVNPLQAGNTAYLLWMIMGFLIVTAVLVVSLGRLGDIYGRVRMYNLGFLVFTVFSILLSVTWLRGGAGALWLIAMRVGQGLGGAMLLANAPAIITDAFPPNQRGRALGINAIAATAGSTVGLVLGGVLAPVSWRLIFLVSVPVGLFGTVWAFLKLRDISQRRPARIDWWGNLTFALGLVVVMVGITDGIQPYASHAMGWTNPRVIAEIGGGIALLGAFAVIESRVAEPMFPLSLFRLRAFTAGNIAGLLSGLGRGGMQLTLIVWLQGIWLPLHGYSFASTPLWAGIYMLPSVFGFMVAGPVSGVLSDRFGPRWFATGGMLLCAATFVLLLVLPVDFGYLPFALLLFANGAAIGLFTSPNRVAVMNSLPSDRRGAGSGMMTTFQNSAMVLSLGVFFSLMIVGLSSTLSGTLLHGLEAHGVGAAAAQRVAHLPPTSTLFASFLGYNPVRSLLGPHVLASLPAGQAALLTGHGYFPSLISQPFADALTASFGFAAACCLIAAAASFLRGGEAPHQRRQRGAAGDETDLPAMPAAH